LGRLSVVVGAERTALVSWSGGKDSCLALWRAQQQGVRVQRLLSALDETGERARSHGVSPQLLRAQALAMGLESQFLSATWRNYEEQFVAALQEAKASGITQAVFGDIDLQPHRDWEEKICARVGFQALLPLWLGNRLELVHEFWRAGFKAVVVCVDDRFLDASFAGRLFDEAFVASLPEGVDACGENGEFHTFVFDGPNFKQPVAWRGAGTQSYTSPPEFGSQTYHFGLIEPA
jgi:uncharacterized protein (TIGR00290 family)